ncbi:MAG: hypothetical protein WDA75_02275 [Candidatus Latescibacterota bacterium]
MDAGVGPVNRDAAGNAQGAHQLHGQLQVVLAEGGRLGDQEGVVRPFGCRGGGTGRARWGIDDLHPIAEEAVLGGPDHRRSYRLTAVDAAFRAASLALAGVGIPWSDGIVGRDGMTSLVHLGRIATQGMRSVDAEILAIMQEKLQ